MSLLPPAMKITDPMPMTLGAAVKKALSQAVPVDSIRAFEVQRLGWVETEPGKFSTINESDCRQIKGAAYVSVKRESTFAEMPEALRQHIGECCTEAIQADEPKPRFKVGDRVQWRADTLRDFGLKQEQWVINHIEGRRLFCSDGTHVFAEDIELIPSPKQEGGWADWEAGEDAAPPVPTGTLVDVRFANGDKYCGIRAERWNWRFFDCPDIRIAAYRVAP